MQKIKAKYIGSEEKLYHFRWIDGIIASGWDKATWEAGEVAHLAWIMKRSLNITALSWFTLVRHMLSPTYRDKVLSPSSESLIVAIMKGYEYDIAKHIVMEICNSVMSLDTILAFPYLIIHIYLDEGVPWIPGVDQLL